jgi:hypothetical protein
MWKALPKCLYEAGAGAQQFHHGGTSLGTKTDPGTGGRECSRFDTDTITSRMRFKNVRAERNHLR